MLIVGYDMTERPYLACNSWGAGWAEQGYRWIPFETMDALSKDEDFWTVGAIEDAAGFSLQGPSLGGSMKAFGVPNDLLEARAARLESLRTGLRSKLSIDLESEKRDFRSRLRDTSWTGEWACRDGGGVTSSASASGAARAVCGQQSRNWTMVALHRALYIQC